MSGVLRLSRRRFLQVLAGTAGALVVGIGTSEADDAPVPLAFLGDSFAGVGPYVRIDAEGNVLIGARDPDTGTGTATALPRIIADELEADWNRVTVVPLGLGVASRNDKPVWIYGHQRSGIGDSIPAAWADLRQAGALARWLLTEAAARRLGVPADRLHCQAGTVIAPDGRRLGYGELAAAAAKLDIPTAPLPLKEPTQYRLIGQPAGDVDARAIVTGQLRYAIDTHPADALVAVLVHCPWTDGSLASIDTADALAVEGVVKVVPLKPEADQPAGQTVIAPAVAVLANTTWAALQGRDKLKLEWKPGPSAAEDSAALQDRAAALLASDAEPTTRVYDDGDLAAAGKKARRRIEASYVQPWLAHATPEPMNCLVRLEKDRASLVVPTQAPKRAWAVVQRLTGLAPDRIDIQVPRVGGGYGRRLDHDFVAEAVMLAKASDGRPVRLLWTREQGLTHDYYRSATTHTVKAIIDRHRQVIGWDQRMASAPALVRRGVAPDRLWMSEVDAQQLPAGLISNYRNDWYALQSLMPRGPHRGMPHTANAFAVQSFVDEIAHALRENPLETQRRLIGKPRQVPLAGGGLLDTGRLLHVLEQVAERIGWSNWLHSVNGLGLACWHVGGAYVAHAMEVVMKGEKLVILRAVCAVDVGRVVNPLGLRGQVAGATYDALSNALNLEITFKNGQVRQDSFKEYPPASMAQLPDEVEVIMVDGDRDPTGASFLAMPTAAPALANAVFRASAVRVRRLPLMKELLRLL